MKTVIVAEKPSQAKLYAAAFSVEKQEKTHITLKPCNTFPNGATITWGFGHLVELENPGAYNENWAKWSLDNLPIVPKEYKFKVADDKVAQFNVVKKLMEDADVLVNACDIDREGSNIFYLILKKANIKNKPIKRLWINSLEPEAVQKGFNNLQDNELDYRMHEEAYARMVADWLVGMNGSPLYSLLLQGKGMHGALSVGRCQTPLVKMIYDRDKAIKTFKPEPFYELAATLTTSSQQSFKTKAVGFKVKTRQELNDFLMSHQLAPNIPLKAKIEKVDASKKVEKSPKLHSLSTLQAAANKKWKYSPKMVLDLMQRLYEAKLLTYPRTDTNFITQAEYDYLVQHLPDYQAVANVSFAANTQPTKRYVDNSKVQEHFAIIPTKTAADPSKLSGLSEQEQNIFNEVLLTTLAMFHKDYMYEETKVHALINDVEFVATGKVELDKGWKALFKSSADSENDSSEEKVVLPAVAENDVIEAIVTEVEGTTKAPKPYTEGQLIDLMKKAGKDADDKDDVAILKEVEGIGTEATRASIIETIKTKGYIEVQKNIVSVTPKGVVLCEAVADSLVSSPILTAKWESKLRNISKGELSATTFIQEISEFIEEMINLANVSISNNAGLSASIQQSQTQNVVAACPVCKKGKMIDRKTFISCDRYKDGCKFSISRMICKKKISDTAIKQLLEKGKTSIIKGFMSSKNAKFDAHLVVKGGKIEFEFIKK